MIYPAGNQHKPYEKGYSTRKLHKLRLCAPKQDASNRISFSLIEARINDLLITAHMGLAIVISNLDGCGTKVSQYGCGSILSILFFRDNQQ